MEKKTYKENLEDITGVLEVDPKLTVGKTLSGFMENREAIKQFVLLAACLGHFAESNEDMLAKGACIEAVRVLSRALTAYQHKDESPEEQDAAQDDDTDDHQTLSEVLEKTAPKEKAKLDELLNHVRSVGSCQQRLDELLASPERQKQFVQDGAALAWKSFLEANVEATKACSRVTAFLAKCLAGPEEEEKVTENKRF